MVIRYGIIGTGAWAREGHIPAINRIDRVQITALCNRGSENLRKSAELIKSPPSLFHEYEKLLERDDVDAVVVCTPINLNKEICIKALSAGKHVLCEKPLSTTLKDCDDIIAKAQSKDKILQVGFQLRYSSFYRRVKKLVEDKSIGEIKMVWAKVFRDPFIAKADKWSTRVDLTGGILNALNSHHFDLFNWFIGRKPVRVCAMGGTAVSQDLDIDNAWVTIEYEQGVTANLGLCLFVGHAPTLEIGIIGEKGRIECNYDSQEILLYQSIEKETTKIKLEKEYVDDGAYNEHLSFIDCIKKGEKPLADGLTAKLSTAIALAARESIKKGCMVEIK